MQDWLDQARARLAAELEGGEELRLSPADVELLLELTRAAAHESGERTNAPLVSYLVGFAHGRGPGRTLEEVVSTALGRPATP